MYDNALFYLTDAHTTIFIGQRTGCQDFPQNTLGQKESEKGHIKQEWHEDSLYYSL